MPGETYYDYGANLWSAKDIPHVDQDGLCVKHTCSEAISENKVIYTCNLCKNVVKVITLDDSVTKYYSANQLNSTAKVYFQGTHSYKWDDANKVAYMESSVLQTIWQRMDHDIATTQTASVAENFTESVGNAKYLVIKARSSDETAYLRFVISTMANNSSIGTITEADFVQQKDSDGNAVFDEDGNPVMVLNETKAKYLKILEDGSTDSKILCSKVGDQYYQGEPKKSVYFMGKGEATGEWVTYVIDLETVCDGFYEKVEGHDYYDVDTFYFHNGGTSDIAYVAFVEGSWAEIDALVDEDVVMQITASGGEKASVGQLVNVADGSLAE